MDRVAFPRSRKALFALLVGFAAAIVLLGTTQLMGRSAHSALPLGVAVEDPAPALPSGARWACPTARAGPVRLARHDQLLVFVSVDGTITANLVWPRGFSARLLDGRAELIARDGSVVAREGDVLDDMGGGIGATGDAFHVCSVAGRSYDPIP